MMSTTVNLILSRTLSGVPASENSTTSRKTPSRSTTSFPLLMNLALSHLSTLPLPRANLSSPTTSNISSTGWTPSCSFSNDALAKYVITLIENSSLHLKLPAGKSSSSLRPLKADSIASLRTCPRFSLISVLWDSRRNWRSLIGRRNGRMVRMRLLSLLVGGLFSRVFEVVKYRIEM